jgi:hypothetical protein
MKEYLINYIKEKEAVSAKQAVQYLETRHFSKNDAREAVRSLLESGEITLGPKLKLIIAP